MDDGLPVVVNFAKAMISRWRKGAPVIEVNENLKLAGWQQLRILYKCVITSWFASGMGNALQPAPRLRGMGVYADGRPAPTSQNYHRLRLILIHLAKLTVVLEISIGGEIMGLEWRGMRSKVTAGYVSEDHN